MSFRKRHRRKSPVKSTTKNKLNLQVIVLTAISCLFCWSLLSHLLSDEPNPETTIVDLDELITINSYDEKTYIYPVRIYYFKLLPTSGACCWALSTKRNTDIDAHTMGNRFIHWEHSWVGRICLSNWANYRLIIY